MRNIADMCITFRHLLWSSRKQDDNQHKTWYRRQDLFPTCIILSKWSMFDTKHEVSNKYKPTFWKKNCQEHKSCSTCYPWIFDELPWKKKSSKFHGPKTCIFIMVFALFEILVIREFLMNFREFFGPQTGHVLDHKLYIFERKNTKMIVSWTRNLYFHMVSS